MTDARPRWEREAKGLLKDVCLRLPLGLRPRAVRRRLEWAVGIHAGPSPLTLRPLGRDAPVLTALDVTDVRADFVADPFLLRRDGVWHLFFEVMDRSAGLGRIGHATSRDARRWEYDRLVLVEPFHLSYPYVFCAGGETWMVPECDSTRSVRLYRAVDFPGRWEHCADLLGGRPFRDASLLHHGERWYLFAETGESGAYDTLRLYVAERLTGPYREHPASPVVEGDPHLARPAGRVVRDGDRLLRFAQDCCPDYGTSVRALEITTLTGDAYSEHVVGDGPLLQAGSARWTTRGMHHVDAHALEGGGWIAAVDGR